MLDAVQGQNTSVWTQYPMDALFKGRNSQEFSVGDTSVGDTSSSPASTEGMGGGGGRAKAEEK
jgi:hypothetical protein